jgi:osmotically-inducible protein OsmY
MYHSRSSWTIAGVALTASLFTSAATVGAQQPDNTAVNKQDRAKGAVTADQQKENTTDRDLTQKIRRSVVGDKSLSTYAHNVKVVAQNGQVTLKGPVRSEDEKRSVEAKAVEVAGAGHVVNEMSVVPAQPKQTKK